jgi:hypothetical protein
MYIFKDPNKGWRVYTRTLCVTEIFVILLHLPVYSHDSYPACLSVVQVPFNFTVYASVGDRRDISFAKNRYILNFHVHK